MQATYTNPFDELELDRVIFVSVAERAKEAWVDPEDINDVWEIAKGSWVASAEKLDRRDMLVVVGKDHVVLGVFHVSGFRHDRAGRDHYSKAVFDGAPDAHRTGILAGRQLPPRLRRKRGQIRGIWFMG